MKRLYAIILLCATPLSLQAPSDAAPAKVYTPATNSAEYSGILMALHGGDHADMYSIKLINIAQASGKRAIAYIDYEGPVGGGHAIMARSGKGPWEEVWAEGDGGSNSCKDGAAHYAWALKFIKGHGVKPDALFPGLTKETADLQKQAKADPELQCVGDLSGGPTQ
jgi:hypothetical protein